jgi:hypothetical protein
LLGRRGPEAGIWTLACALCFVLPIAVAGLAKTERERPDPLALTPGLVEALRADVPVGDAVFATPAASYRIAGFAPVYIATAPPGNVAQTSANRPFKRRRDANRFFFGDISDAERAEILERYGASWLVVDKTQRVPSYVRTLGQPVFEDARYVLYPVDR